jgi:hypothetical protein
MAGFRVQSKQAETPSNFVQYISGKAAAALTYEIAPDFVEIFLRFGRECVARHLALMLPSIQRREHFGHNGFAVEAFALAKRLEPRNDFCVDVVPAEPAPLRKVSPDCLAN